DPRVRADLARIGATVARDEREHVALRRREQERLDDLGGFAADRLRSRLGGGRAAGELLDARVRGGRAHVRGHALDSLGPRPHASQRNRGASFLVLAWKATEGDEMQDDAGRARTEALFRDVNERIAETAERF